MGTFTVTNNDKNKYVSYYFEWGLDESLSETPITGGMSASFITNAASKQVTGLERVTTYYYKFCAEPSWNSNTYCGTTVSFSTIKPKPTATTQDPTNIGSTSVTLNGVINANGNDTTGTFSLYDASWSNTRITATPNPVTGDTDTNVSAEATGLSPNSEYKYQLVANNGESNVVGDLVYFTTADGPSPPTATTQAPTDITATTATLNGLVNPNGDDATVSFDYGLDSNYGSSVSYAANPVNGTSDASVSADLADLAPGTTYHFRVAATNDGGTTHGEDMTFTTSTPAPTAATQAATNVTGTSATINGQVNPNGFDATVSFDHGADAGYGSSASFAANPVNGTSNVNVSVNLADLTPGTTYHYRVAATNNGGTAYGEDMTFTTKPNNATLATFDALRMAYLDCSATIGTWFDASAATDPAAINTDRQVHFPSGAFSFTISGLEAGGAVTMLVRVDQDARIDGYYLNNTQTSVWENVISEANGAVDQESTQGETALTFDITDGGPYDADEELNGAIQSVGGPGYPSSILGGQFLSTNLMLLLIEQGPYEQQ